ncbi:MAG TPA: hypothetical protein VMW34_01875 [Anaerolineales bacterium]|nr:hypothetical protein [Anaerolineales bacterium]
MEYKKILPTFVLFLFLFACSNNPEADPTNETTPLVATPEPLPTKIPAEITREPDLGVAAPTSTSTLEDVSEAQADSQTPGQQAPLADLGLPEYGVIATFHWLGLTTPTDITYNYEGWFNVRPDGSLQMVDKTKGYATGNAGMNFNGECIEAVPVDIQYDFTISGKRTDVSMSDVDAEVLMKYPDLVAGDDFQMFDLKFESPEITKIDIPPFVNCMPDADQEFLNSLGTFWITTIPFIPPEYLMAPADQGYSCPGVLSYNEEGLGSLEICYNIFLPQKGFSQASPGSV